MTIDFIEVSYPTEQTACPFQNSLIPAMSKQISTQAASTDRPWQTMGIPLEEVNPIQSMIGQDESLYLHWLARTRYQGIGEIVDGGPLMGGSSYALASGLARNSAVLNKRKRIHSYDLWIYFEGFRTASQNRVIGETDLREGDSLLPLFLQNTQHYAYSIRPYRGDISQRLWGSRPIEILFIDCAKSWDIHNHMVNQFFGCLIPNQSIVLQQDYHHYYCYWIHLVMQFFSLYFRRAHNINGGTVPFLLTQKLPEELLSVDYSRYFTKAEAIKLMDAAIAEVIDIGKSCVIAAKIRLLGEMQEFEQAAALAQSLLLEREWFARPGTLYDVVRAQAELPPSLVYPGIADVSKIVGASCEYIVSRDYDTFYAVPRTAAGFDITNRQDRNRTDIMRAQSLPEIEERIGQVVEPISVDPNFVPCSSFFPR